MNCGSFDTPMKETPFSIHSCSWARRQCFFKVCSVFTYMHMCSCLPLEARRGHQISQSLWHALGLSSFNLCRVLCWAPGTCQGAFGEIWAFYSLKHPSYLKLNSCILQPTSHRHALSFAEFTSWQLSSLLKAVFCAVC